MAEFPNQFANQYVRDLAWVVGANSCINTPLTPADVFFESELQALLPTLNTLDKAPTPLTDFLKKSKRITLGNYFEDLVEFWLSHRANTKILARNMQIQDRKITIGECDFIVEMDGKITHIEVATKFYLAIENSSDHAAWVGRGLADRLDMKIDKMFSHQLNLSNTEPMQDELAKHGFHEIQEKLAIFKGYFFEYYFTDSQHKHPENCNINNDRAYWCKISELRNLPKIYSEWQLLSKPHWFTYHDDWISIDEISNNAQRYFENVKNTPVLCNSRSGEKIQKFFIAPNSWPESNSPKSY